MGKNIIYISKNDYYYEDLELTFIMRAADSDYEIKFIKDIKNLDEEIKITKPDYVIVNCDSINDRDDWDLNVPVVAHPVKEDDPEIANEKGIPCIDIAEDNDEVVDAINNFMEAPQKYLDKKPKKINKPKKDPTIPKNNPQNDMVSKKNKENPNRFSKTNENHENETPEEKDEDDDENESLRKKRSAPAKSREEQIREKRKPAQKGRRYEEEYDEDDDEYDDDEYDDDYNEEYDNYDDDHYDEYDEDEDEDYDYEEEQTPRKKEYHDRDIRRNSRRNADKPGYREETRSSGRARGKNKDTREKPVRKYRDEDEYYEERPKRKGSVPKENNERKSTRNRKEREDERPSRIKKEAEYDDYADEKFHDDMNRNSPGKTKVVTVYSAKGGVGKTTIATELAVFLSKVQNQKERLRICIVDYNIDFGDVRATLALKQDDRNVTDWAKEIQELIEKGESPDEITYSKRGIEEFLLTDKKSGIYILAAPATNEDSMDIESESLEIIMRNLINNGDFDYIICDTGNNTRDSTMIALEFADIVLMIMTQNVNTAQCDRAFINTMKAIDFDLSNVKMIINNIMPPKSTSITVQEIIDCFPDYECVGKIKFNTDVIKATNEGLPLVHDPSNEFTKQIREIAAYVLENNEILNEPEPEKKGIFARIFKRKS